MLIVDVVWQLLASVTLIDTRPAPAPVKLTVVAVGVPIVPAVVLLTVVNV